MTERMSSWLEKWAYIMIIIVCFTILFTLLVCVVIICWKKNKNVINCLNERQNESFKKCQRPDCEFCMTHTNTQQLDQKLLDNKRDSTPMSTADALRNNLRPPLSQLTSSQSKLNSVRVASYGDPNHSNKDKDTTLSTEESSSSLNSHAHETRLG